MSPSSCLLIIAPLVFFSLCCLFAILFPLIFCLLSLSLSSFFYHYLINFLSFIILYSLPLSVFLIVNRYLRYPVKSCPCKRVICNNYCDKSVCCIYLSKYLIFVRCFNPSSAKRFYFSFYTTIFVGRICCC